MELKKVTYHKVTELPQVLLPDALYFIKPENAEYADWVITDINGNPFEIASDERIERLLLPYDDSVLPTNGQTLIFNGTNFVPATPAGGGLGNVPVGGSDNQVLTKIDDTNYNTEWRDIVQGNFQVIKKGGSFQNDAYQLVNGSVVLNNYEDGDVRYRGYRFENIDLPQNTLFNSAVLEVYYFDGTPITVNIGVEQTSTPSVFTTTVNDLSSRTVGTQISWIVGQNPISQSTRYISPDFSSLLNELSNTNNITDLSIILESNSPNDQHWWNISDGDESLYVTLFFSYVAQSTPLARDSNLSDIVDANIALTNIGGVPYLPNAQPAIGDYLRFNGTNYEPVTIVPAVIKTSPFSLFFPSPGDYPINTLMLPQIDAQTKALFDCVLFVASFTNNVEIVIKGSGFAEGRVYDISSENDRDTSFFFSANNEVIIPVPPTGNIFKFFSFRGAVSNSQDFAQLKIMIRVIEQPTQQVNVSAESFVRYYILNVNN